MLPREHGGSVKLLSSVLFAFAFSTSVFTGLGLLVPRDEQNYVIFIFITIVFQGSFCIFFIGKPNQFIYVFKSYWIVVCRMVPERFSSVLSLIKIVFAFALFENRIILYTCSFIGWRSINTYKFAMYH
jgi:hypothetical protein